MAKIVSAKASKNTSAAIKNNADWNEEVSKLAYQYFIERGGEHGHDAEDWLRAEAEIKKRKL